MNVRRSMIRVLMEQQSQRLRKNPAAILLLILIVSIAILVGTGGLFKGSSDAAKPVARYWLIHDGESAWAEHLREHPPEGTRVTFLSRDEVRFPLPARTEAIEIRTPQEGREEAARIVYHSSTEDLSSLGNLPEWLWRESAIHFGHMAFDVEKMAVQPPPKATGSSALESTSIGQLLTPGMVAVMLIFSVQFFTCTHMLVSLAGQDRERGTSLALALTPASLEEILIARMLFHLAVSVTVSGLIVAILAPHALLNGMMWAVLVTGSLGFVAVGTLISSITSSQGTAGLSVVCYMLVGAIVFYLAARFPAVALARQASFEHYGFPLLIHSIRGGGWSLAAGHLFLRMAVLVAVWFAASFHFFRRMGWQ